MAFRVKGSSSAPAASPKVAAVPQASKVGKQPSEMPDVGNEPKPVRSRRDYGKVQQMPPGVTVHPNPFGPGYGGS